MSFCKRTEKENIIKIISFDTITLSSDEVTANKCRSICNFLIRPKAVTQFFFRTRAIDIHDNRFEYCRYFFYHAHKIKLMNKNQPNSKQDFVYV